MYRLVVLTAFLLATIAVPPVLAFALRRTRVWWLAGAALAAVGVYLLATLEHDGDHGDGGIAGYSIGNLLQLVYGAWLLLYAAILGAVASSMRRTAIERSKPPIPTARVVSDQSTSSCRNAK